MNNVNKQPKETYIPQKKKNDLEQVNLIENKTVSTAVAVACSQSRKLKLTDAQLPLFHAAKACFESSDTSKALMYQDDQTVALQMRNIKLFVIRCSNMAPGITAEFMRSVLENFRVMVNGKLQGKAVFTPRCLITPWIWELVVDSLPESTVTPELRESIRGLFKKKG